MAGGGNGGTDYEVMQWLLAMPLLDRRELVAVTGLPRSTAYREVGRLVDSGMLAGVTAAMPGARPSTRLYLTGLGIALTASAMGVTTDALMRVYPVSAHWLRLLLVRLETVAAVYRIAADLSEVSPIRRFVWYRKLPLDAGIELENGSVIGVIREGPMAPSAHLMRRVRTLALNRHPDTLLVIAPDRVRVREWRQRLSMSAFRALLAVEGDVIAGGPDVARWAASFDPKPYGLADVVRLAGGGRLPAEPANQRRSTPPVDLEERAEALRAAPASAPVDKHLLPLVLHGGEKRLMGAVALWPLATIADLMGLLGMTKGKVVNSLRLLSGLGLVERLRLHKRTRFVLSNRGLIYLARRDRVSPGRLIRQWSPNATDVADRPLVPRVRGSRLGDLLRHIGHTAAVYRFWAELGRQVRAAGGEVLNMQPPHRSHRRYSVSGHFRTLKPDGYAHVRLNGQDRHFFLEWEQRAAYPSQFLAKLQPYFSYFETRRPLEDHGEYPVLLVVLRDEIVATQFLKMADRWRADRSMDRLAILVTHGNLHYGQGPLAAIWRRPEDLCGAGRRTRPFE